jgi:hypothetical protein
MVAPRPTPDVSDGGEATREEVTMIGGRTATMTAPVVLLAIVISVALLAFALAPASALAAWTSAEAHIVDPRGTGVVPLLNVTVANHATNDSSPVTTVHLSDDEEEWYVLPYTGEPCVWTLGGEEGRSSVAVRFGAADGSLSQVVHASIRVDTSGPVTLARKASSAGAGRTALRFVVRDSGSPHVTARLVVRGNGLARRYELGRVRTGERTTVLRLRLPAGMYRWRIQATDLAGWAQRRQTAGRLVVR